MQTRPDPVTDGKAGAEADAKALVERCIDVLAVPNACSVLPRATREIDAFAAVCKRVTRPTDSG